MRPPALNEALERLDEAANHLSLDPAVLEKLRHPRETTKTRLLIRMDDGSRKAFMAWRCRYDDTRGPTKGGIRFHPEVTVDEVETLAFWMTIKCAVMNLPFGGGKGAVRVEPHELSHAELERLSRAYIQAFASIIGPNRDIPAPDVYTNAMIMGWMADEYSTIVGHIAWDVITGKPIALGGSLGRDDATARGGFYLLRHLHSELGLKDGASVAIQGFGNAGIFMARLVANHGYKVVAVTDSRHCLHDPAGLDVEAVIAAKEAGDLASIAAGNDRVKLLAPESIVGLDCDVLVPAALENLVHGDNARDVKARIIVELANGPLTNEADRILAERGVIVLPDILANAGGVTVSYFEWVQNRQGVHWSLAEVHERLKAAMETEGRAVWDLATQRGVTVRNGAYMHALKRLAAAIEAHGTQQFFSS